jgi:hypothetical protein
MSEVNNSPSDGRDTQMYEYGGYSFKVDDPIDCIHPITSVLEAERPAGDSTRETYVKLVDLYDEMSKRARENDRKYPGVLTHERASRAFRNVIGELIAGNKRIDSELVIAVRHIIHFHDFDVDVVDQYEFERAQEIYNERNPPEGNPMDKSLQDYEEELEQILQIQEEEVDIDVDHRFEESD